MCIRISSGVKEVPKLRQCDITFTLTVILNTLTPITAKPFKGSDSSAGLNQQMQHSLHQVGFLGSFSITWTHNLIIAFEYS